MPRVIVVEYAYDTVPTEAEMHALERKLSDCLEVREAKRVRTYVSGDRAKRFTAFQAADAEAVRNAHRSAGVPFKAVWVADESE